MKQIKTIFKAFLILIFVTACTESEDLDFLENIPVPVNIAATYNISQDNSGDVTIIPSAEGATTFDVYFGDATADPINLAQGKSIKHTYAEGTYDVKIVAYNSAGKTAEFIQPLVVSFQAPKNLLVTVANDAAISKQVNVTAEADFATMYEFYSGETGVSQPVATANIGETLNYQYATAGTYDVKVIAKGGAIATAEYTASFEVTEILAPLSKAPTPPNKNAEDVVSIFSDAYTDITLTELPTSWSSGNFEATTIEDNNVWKLTNLDFLGMVSNYDSGVDLSAMETLHIDYWVPTGSTNELIVKIVNTVDGGEDVESLGTTVGGSWQSIELDMAGFDGGNLANKNKITQLLIDSDGISGVVYIDNFYFYKAATTPTTAFDSGLLNNGDFENGSDSWLVGVDDASAAPVVTDGDNTYYSVNVTAAGNSFDVNTSQKLEIVQGNTYTLTFDAWSDGNRAILAGIGLSGGDFSNDAKNVDITNTRATYSITLSSNNFGAADARVFFDLGAETGLVNLDNVSLILGTGNLLSNGKFDNGSASWLTGVDDASSVPVVTDAGNSYYSVDVTAAGNSFDVNMSQKLEIIQGTTYNLTFDAWSNGDRSIIAGIGLSDGDFSNNSETVNITATRVTYNLTLTADSFGAANARVLFDSGAETGVVNIDNVSLSAN